MQSKTDDKDGSQRDLSAPCGLTYRQPFGKIMQSNSACDQQGETRGGYRLVGSICADADKTLLETN